MITTNKKQNTKSFIKNNKKLLIGLIIGIILSGTIASASTIYYAADEVGYNDAKRGSTLGASDVKTALNKVYEKMIPNFEVGDYVTVVPDTSSYTIEANTVTGYGYNQTINPNELTLWRIINIDNDGSIDAVSEYVSSKVVYFQGTIGYANFVAVLQTLASKYAKEGVTTGTRMMGYDGQTLTISDTSAFDGTTTTAPSENTSAYPTTGTGQEYLSGVAGDTLYLKDYQLVQNVYQQDNNTTNYCDTGLCAYKVGTTSKQGYWLASRNYYYDSDPNITFMGRYIFSDGIIRGMRFRQYYSDSWNDFSYPYYLRPIITFKSGLMSAMGDGSKDNPYTLS